MDDRLKPAAIYIQGLPTSIGNIQVEDICKKAGKIKKIKVYRDAGGVPKGDALVVFEAKRDRDVAAHQALLPHLPPVGALRDPPPLRDQRVLIDRDHLLRATRALNVSR